MLEPELIRFHSPDNWPRTGKLCGVCRINFFFIYQTLNSCQNSVRIQRGGENLEHGDTILILQTSYLCQVRSCPAHPGGSAEREASPQSSGLSF